MQFNGGVAAASPLELALVRSEGTVTALLEGLVGEPIDAEPLGHRTLSAGASGPLEVPPGHPLLDRSARLVGRRSGHPYVFAATVLVPGRLPEGFVGQLTSGHRPIGRILEAEGLMVTREPLRGPDPIGGPVTVTGAPMSDDVPPAGDVLLARTYRVLIDGAPVMVISEWFLTTLAPFLPR